MMAKLYDSLTIILILLGISAVVLIIYYRDALFKQPLQVGDSSILHEYLLESFVAVDSQWLRYVQDIRGAKVLLPDGYEAILYVADLNNPQEMAYIESADLVVVSERNTGNIVLLKDTNLDGSADSKRIFISSLPKPRGVAYTSKGDLYVGTESSILLFKDFLDQIRNETSEYSEIVSNLPKNDDGLEVAVGLNKLFVSIPSYCGYCIETDKRKGSIVQYEEDGTKESIYATGLREATSMGFIQGSLVSSERSASTAEFPVDDEFNIVKRGNDYGWPYYVNSNQLYTPFSPNAPIGINPVEPAFLLGVDSNPLGFEFFEQDNTLRLALKGSKKVVDINYLTSETSDFTLMKIGEEDILDPVDVEEYKQGTLILDKSNGLIFYIRKKSI